jgi:acyl-CoA thioesterase-2
VISEADEKPITRLIDQLGLEQLDRDLYIAAPVRGEGRLFGGLVAAMSVMAAGRSIPPPEGRHLHSLHAYFLRPGRHEIPIRFAVDRIRDGRSFTTRRVVALQGGEAIFNLSASFATPEEGLEHQNPIPEAPEPLSVPDWEQLRSKQQSHYPTPEHQPIELRVCDPNDLVPGHKLTTNRMMWMRPRGPIPDDPLLHAAILVYATDRTLLSTVARVHGLVFGQFLGASLDHAVWLHRIPRFDDWVLFVANSPVSHSARGLIHAAMYSAEGNHIASVAQEGLMRLPKKDAT